MHTNKIEAANADGITHATALSCCTALQTLAAAATPERLIAAAVERIEQAGGDSTPEAVTAMVYADFVALVAAQQAIEGANHG